MNWIEVKANFAEAPADWSIFIDIFDRHGLENTLQSDNPAYLSACVVEVDGHESVIDALRADLIAAGVESVETKPLVEENWDEVWRQFFKPRRIGRRFVIRPTWEEYETQSGDLEIVLDPGQAFGTGDHPTTRMCLELLETLEVAGKRVADVGCGSGILSVGAVLLGASEVNGVDIDPLSVEVAKENAERNGVSARFVVGDSIFSLPDGPYHLVVSNIISATLIGMAPDIADSMEANGEWVVSGIIEQNWPDVRAAAEREGFVLTGERREDGWVGASFRWTG